MSAARKLRPQERPKPLAKAERPWRCVVCSRGTRRGVSVCSDCAAATMRQAERDFRRAAYEELKGRVDAEREAEGR